MEVLHKKSEGYIRYIATKSDIAIFYILRNHLDIGFIGFSCDWIR